MAVIEKMQNLYVKGLKMFEVLERAIVKKIVTLTYRRVRNERLSTREHLTRSGIAQVMDR